MKQNEAFTIVMQKTQQVSPDDYQVFPVSMELTDATTIFDIKIWASKEFGTDFSKVNLIGAKIGRITKAE